MSPTGLRIKDSEVRQSSGCQSRRQKYEQAIKKEIKKGNSHSLSRTVEHLHYGTGYIIVLTILLRSKCQLTTLSKLGYSS